MMMENAANHDRAAPAWDDLEAFGVIVHGLQVGNTLQQIGEDPHSTFKSARMLYLRLARLERALGKRLIDRRPWGRRARLTDDGERLARFVEELLDTRRRLQSSFAEPAIPTLRLATHATLVTIILPKVLEQRRARGLSPAVLRIEPSVVQGFPEALAAVVEGRADVAFYLAPPGAPEVRLPSAVRGERLLRTELLLLCAPAHRFAERLRQNPRATVRATELADELIIGRPFFRNLAPAPGPRGGWITVPHSLDMLPYIHLGLGVGFHARVVYELLGRPSDLVALPLEPSFVSTFWLLLPRKRWRPLSAEAEEFIGDLRAFFLARRQHDGGGENRPRRARPGVA